MIEYIGEIISEPCADRRESKYHYGCYMFGVGKGKSKDRKDIIDATFRGNMARYLNHSCDVSVCLFSLIVRPRLTPLARILAFSFTLSETSINMSN